MTQRSKINTLLEGDEYCGEKYGEWEKGTEMMVYTMSLRVGNQRSQWKPNI